MKIALLFPGYGSQFVGMGKELYDEYRIVQEYFEEASNCLNINFVKLCFASSDVELGAMLNAYTSLFLVGSATYALLKEQGIIPDIVAGYNNGESAALFAASCFTLPDGLYLLSKYCASYQEIVGAMDVDAMHVFGASTAVLAAACQEVSDDENKVFIALHNNASDHIVAGSRTCLSQLQDVLNDAKIEYVGIEVGLHSLLVNSVVDAFKHYLEKVDFNDLKIPLISGVDGAVINSGADAKERFITHINSPVEFTKVIEKLVDYDCILVATPGDKLCKAIKKLYPEKIVMAIAKKSDIDTLKEMNI